MSEEENQTNEEQVEAVEQPSGPRNASSEKGADRIGRKADRRAERKLPVSGSEPTEDDLEEEDSSPDPAED
jgi:hypothetical protein